MQQQHNTLSSRNANADNDRLRRAPRACDRSHITAIGRRRRHGTDKIPRKAERMRIRARDWRHATSAVVWSCVCVCGTAAEYPIVETVYIYKSVLYHQRRTKYVIVVRTYTNIHTQFRLHLRCIIIRRRCSRDRVLSASPTELGFQIYMSRPK